MRDAAAMQSFGAAAAAGQPLIGSHHPGHVQSQYTGSSTAPAHQAPVRHSHAVVDNAYASMPGTLNCFSLSLMSCLML